MVFGNRYNRENIRRIIDNPKLIQGEIRRIGTSINSRYYRWSLNDETVDVMDEDWDTLVILDACRHDAYREVENAGAGYKISNATKSWDFMQKNFLGETHHDTLYVTANPFASRLDSSTFFKMVQLIDSHWNEELDTVMPTDVTNVSLDLFDEYPQKRYIIHFMQPHYPFIGPKGDNIDHTGYNRDQGDPESTAPNIWWVLQYGHDGYDGVTEENVWKAYKENLSIALEHVHRLIENLPGKTVVTADHGTMIGDAHLPVPIKGFGHAHGAFVPPVVKVPWDVHENGERREVTEEEPLENQQIEQETVSNRLRMLGYRD